MDRADAKRPHTLRYILYCRPFRLIAAILLTAICVAAALKLHWLPTQMQPSPYTEYVNASDGKWTYDFRDTDMSGNSYSLQSEYHYGEQYIMPEDIDKAKPTFLPLDYPVTDDYITQRFIILLPDDGRIYKLQFYKPSLKVYINGELVGQNGNPGTSWADNELRKRNFSLYATPVDGKIELVTHTSVWNLYDDRAFRVVPLLSYANQDYLHPYSQNYFTYLVIGSLFGAALLLVCMFFTHRRMIHNLSFAVACVAMGIMYSTVGQYDHFITVFQAVGGKLAFYLGCLSVPVMAVCVIYYLCRMFPGVSPRWLRVTFYVVSVVFIGFILLTDPRFFTWLATFYYPLIGAAFMYFLIVLALRLRKPMPEQYVSLYGLVILALGAANDICMNLGLFRLRAYSASLVPVAMLLFVLSQLVSLYIGNNRRAAEAREAERRVAEENRMLEEMNRLKTEFLGNVSHELKTPLTVMSGYAQKSRRDLSGLPGTEETERSVRLIGSEADRLALMVSQILDVTRIEEGRMSVHPEPASLLEIVQDTANAYYPVFTKNNNRLELSGIPDLPEVLCDRQRVTQVLVNLIANAARHTRDGVIAISAAETEGFVAVTVSDTGEGITPELLPHVFDRFKSMMKIKRPAPATIPAQVLGSLSASIL